MSHEHLNCGPLDKHMISINTLQTKTNSCSYNHQLDRLFVASWCRISSSTINIGSGTTTERNCICCSLHYPLRTFQSCLLPFETILTVDLILYSFGVPSTNIQQFHAVLIFNEAAVNIILFDRPIFFNLYIRNILLLE